MKFEEVLPQLKNGAKVIRQNWHGAEEYVRLVETTELAGVTLTPYFVINVTGEGYTVFQPTVCDILADDWVIVSE